MGHLGYEKLPLNLPPNQHTHNARPGGPAAAQVQTNMRHTAHEQNEQIHFNLLGRRCCYTSSRVRRQSGTRARVIALNINKTHVKQPRCCWRRQWRWRCYVCFGQWSASAANACNRKNTFARKLTRRARARKGHVVFFLLLVTFGLCARMRDVVTRGGRDSWSMDLITSGPPFFAAAENELPPKTSARKCVNKMHTSSD